MHHIHLKEIDSTQEYLRKEIENYAHPCLVTCERQINGKGQYDRGWVQFEGTMCYSASWEPASNPSLTSIELGVLISQFVQEKFGVELFLKWPNDILNKSGEKVGGILIQNFSDNKYIFGLGLNVFNKLELKEQNFKYNFIFNKNIKLKELAVEMYNFLLSNRISSNLICEKWNKKSYINGKKIELVQKDQLIQGVFEKIDTDGSALIDGKNYYTGSIKLV